MAEGTRLKALDDRIGTNETRLKEVCESINKNQEGVNIELEKVNQKMENVDKSLEELKALMGNMQMRVDTTTQPHHVVPTESPSALTTSGEVIFSQIHSRIHSTPTPPLISNGFSPPNHGVQTPHGPNQMHSELIFSQTPHVNPIYSSLTTSFPYIDTSNNFSAPFNQPQYPFNYTYNFPSQPHGPTTQTVNTHHNPLYQHSTHQSTNYSHSPYFNPFPKLEFPKFNGVDPPSLGVKAEQYFDFVNIEESRKVKFAGMHFEGKACVWFRYYQSGRGVIGWKTFVQDVINRFENPDQQDPQDMFNKLKQTHTVSEYEDSFEELRSQIMVKTMGWGRSTIYPALLVD